MTTPRNAHTVMAEIPDDVGSVITAELLFQQLRSDVSLTVVDVRESEEIHDGGTICGARTFPLQELHARMPELVDLHYMPVVLVSRRGSRARAAAMELSVAGFGEILVLDGGITRWLELGFPIEHHR